MKNTEQKDMAQVEKLTEKQQESIKNVLIRLYEDQYGVKNYSQRKGTGVKPEWWTSYGRPYVRIATNCLTAALILWETTDLQWFPATLAITAAAAFLICARKMVKKK